jgi:predicted negative regulator of RcsB-dependent stress response
VDGNISEQQQVEEIKKWLHENGTAILAGLVIGLSAVFGWRAWDGHRHDTAQQASVAYMQMVDNYKTGKLSVAALDGDDIIAHYGKTNYATFSALLLAGIKVEMGDTTAAIAHLQWAVGNAQQPELKQLAMLRLAQLLLSEKKIDEALKQVEAMDPTQYVALRAELLGDLYRAKGEPVKARSAYQDALKALGKGTDGLRDSISMKLDAVGGAPVAEQAS